MFGKERDYYITSMTCYVDLAVNITKLPKYDLANVILRGGIDNIYGKISLYLAKASGSGRTSFAADKSRRSNYIDRVEFFYVESQKT